MLRLPPFSYRRPTSLADAARILSDEGPQARVVAGGTDLWPNMKRRHQQAETVIGLTAIRELDGIEPTGGDGETRIGATTRLSAVGRDAKIRAQFPALARAVESISSPPLRNMGTLGGNLCLDTRCTYYNQTEGWRRSIDYCLKEAGEICWVAPGSSKCWAHSASDSAPILCALGARLRLVSTQGERMIRVEDLFENDGMEYLSKGRDEILAEIYLPASSSASHCRSSFWKLRRRGTIDFAVLTVAAVVWFDDRGRVENASVHLGAVGSRPLLVPGVAERLRGSALDADAIADIGAAARRFATPMDNTDFHTQWRGVMTARYTEAAMREIAGVDPGLDPPRHPMLY